MDRCEIIECSGYITEEKIEIAKRFLLPRQVQENGLSGAELHAPSQAPNVNGKVDGHRGDGGGGAGPGVVMADEVLLKVITEYTREVS